MPPRHPLLLDAIRLSQSGRNTEAIALMRKAGDEGDAESLFVLGEVHWRGGMASQDLPQAREFYRKAGNLGHGGGAIAYTNLLASGVAGKRDWAAALLRLKAEAQTDARRRAALEVISSMSIDSEGEPLELPSAVGLSVSPDIRQWDRLFTPAECTYLRDLAGPLYQRSMVQSGGRLVDDPIRTSDGASIHWLIEDPAVHALNRRLAAAAEIDAVNGEPLQILRYGGGQQYRPHLDALGTAPERVATALIYLNDDFSGGETVFGKLGVTITPKAGQAIVFRNVDNDGRPDRETEHAGLPVTKGTKYLASRWIRGARWVP